MLKLASREVSMAEVANRQTHMDQQQREQLQRVLEHRKVLFDGKLGCYPHKKFHIELEADAKPFWQRAYPIPHWYRDVYVEQIEDMING
mmetsp:Transcript_33512/g.49282  ORF Transcript_33512/g.49282 Transcript_33512/m.49282 type:complete len:89 (+) Transcript_33512:167-433(+)